MVEKIYTYQNTVQRNVGISEQGLSTCVLIVGRKLLQLKASINHIVIGNAGMNTIERGLREIRAICGKVVKLLKTRYYELRLLLENGGKKYLSGITMPVFYVEIDVVKEIGLKYIQTTLKDLQIIPNLHLMSAMEGLSVPSVIERRTLGETMEINCDVIRKRYAKFIRKEEQWQKI